ncbi:hypothetical protein AN958_11431 [Leucoagaricus sp. SymC.cos]|nr:hypothetical protein AN958_11431 [Leucoagaricus sp. SymC.cos]
MEAELLNAFFEVEDSLEELKAAIRAKLGLGQDAIITLSQIRDGTNVDLEDEDDFDAFYNVLHQATTAAVRVTVNHGAKSNNAQTGEASNKKKKPKTDARPQSSPVESRVNVASTPASAKSAPASRKRVVSVAQSDVTKSVDRHSANEPPAKRPKTTPTSTENHPQSTPVPIPPHSKPDDASSRAVPPAPEKETGISPPRVSAAGPPSTVQASEAGDKQLKRKQKKKGADNATEAAKATPLTAREILEKAKERRETEVKQGKQPPVGSTPLSSNSETAVAKELVPADRARPKDTKYQKAKSTTATDSSQKDTQATGETSDFLSSRENTDSFQNLQRRRQDRNQKCGSQRLVQNPKHAPQFLQLQMVHRLVLSQLYPD